VTLSRRNDEKLSRLHSTKSDAGSEGTVRLESVESIEEASSEGDEGGVSRAELGVVGRVEMGARNLNTGVAEAGGVGGWIGRGEGGSGAIERTAAMDLRGGIGKTQRRGQ
jgi:hypothetical protein